VDQPVPRLSVGDKHAQDRQQNLAFKSPTLKNNPMNLQLKPLKFWLAGLVCLMFTATSLFAQPPGKGGGGGGDTSGYTLVDLLSPYHVIDGNWSGTSAIQVSGGTIPGSPVHVIGFYERDNIQNAPCLWTVNSATSVIVEDLSDWVSVNSVNSAGILGGSIADETSTSLPAVRLASGIVVTLPTPGSGWGQVRAITELAGESPDRTFQAVGTHSAGSQGGPSATLWTIGEDGEVISAQPLQAPDGLNLYARDVNQYGQTSGSVVIESEASAAFAAFDEFGDLRITPLFLDYAIFVYLWDIYLNDSGDVMAFAGEPIDGMHGTLGRTFVWPASGGMIHLSDLNNGDSVSGHDIATVDGKLQVVGHAFASKGRFAFLFNNGQLLNINNLVKAGGWELWLANGVSNAGHICGRGRLTIKNKTQHHGYVLLKK